MSKKLTTKREKRERRKVGIRARISGTKEKPRLCVFRSLKSVYLQIIDDETKKTLVAIHSDSLEAVSLEGKTKKVAEAFVSGKMLAEKAIALGIKRIVFDRAGYAYHGRVRAAAEGAREGGLEF